MSKTVLPVIEIEGVPGEGVFIVIDGTRVAERLPGQKWIAIEPGWQVIGGDTGECGELPREIVGPSGPITLQ